MEEKNMREFSWTALFFVTSFCFFSFSGALKILGSVQNGLFIWVGTISLFLGLLCQAGKFLSHEASKRRRDLTS
jgi:hypothetical protein